MNALSILFDEVESELARIYDFELTSSAKDFLLAEKSDYRHSRNERAAVLVRQDQSNDVLEMGVYFHPEVLGQIGEFQDQRILNRENLDTFCVFVEELSHFHLIYNRARTGSQVSRIELEWQGEIDKVLIAGYWLLKQTGSPCFRLLTHLIFDCSQTTSPDSRVYEEALRYAAQHWYKLLDEAKTLRADEQLELAGERFRAIYKLPWIEKVSLLQRRS